MDLGARLDRARWHYGPSWPPTLARYLSGVEPELTEKVLEDLAYLEAVHEVSWEGREPVFRGGL